MQTARALRLRPRLHSTADTGAHRVLVLWVARRVVQLLLARGCLIRSQLVPKMRARVVQRVTDLRGRSHNRQVRDGVAGRELRALLRAARVVVVHHETVSTEVVILLLVARPVLGRLHAVVPLGKEVVRAVVLVAVFRRHVAHGSAWPPLAALVALTRRFTEVPILTHAVEDFRVRVHAHVLGLVGVGRGWELGRLAGREHALELALLVLGADFKVTHRRAVSVNWKLLFDLERAQINGR